MHTYSSCKICHVATLRTIKTYRVESATQWPWDEVASRVPGLTFPLHLRLSLCVACGFLFYRDTLTFAEMKKFYQAEARYAKPSHHQLKPGREWELRQLVTFLQPTLKQSQVKTALDVGAGDFVALDRVAKVNRHIRFDALDPSYPNNTHNTITVFRTMLEDFQPKKQYDLVTAIHIFEHVGNLTHFIEQIGHIVKPNGLLYIEVPFQVGPGLLFNRAASVEHVNYFTPQTLRYFVARHGFVTKRCEFDTGAYRYNGMQGMIRLLAQKQVVTPTPPGPAHTLGFLINPLPMFIARKVTHG